LGSEVETTADVPATPAGADNVNDPVTEAPPTTEPVDSTTVFNVSPAAGFKLSVARPVIDGLVTLVAVTVTVIFEGTSGGAVYLPEAEIVPAAGLTDHVTAEFASPANVGTNVRDSPADRVAAPGVIVIEGAGELVAPVFVIGATSAANTAFHQRHQLVGSVQISGLVVGLRASAVPEWSPGSYPRRARRCSYR